MNKKNIFNFFNEIYQKYPVIIRRAVFMLLIIFVAYLRGYRINPNELNVGSLNIIKTPQSQIAVIPTITKDSTIPLLPSTPTIDPNTFEFEVFANKSWQDTGLEVYAYQDIKINYISGSWTENIKDVPFHGPDVENNYKENLACLPLQEEGPNLIGLFGTDGIEKIGYFYFNDFPDLQGRLFLRLNDCDSSLENNEGSILVEITIE